ncbi:hypothetical protein IFM89_012666 [Coptis chinensis]|uniref:Pentatricopeptide repeat-containing protein n=1 Tax=Coptis chinensis TaxID=261450 RepID=A0A835H5J3_9MAGN|nr:hypothetical protein IFM89_012666 [Coptis chinensis]
MHQLLGEEILVHILVPAILASILNLVVGRVNEPSQMRILEDEMSIIMAPKPTTIKYHSGSEKRKKKQRLDDVAQSQKGNILKFFGNKGQVESSSETVVVDVEQRSDDDNGEHELNEDVEALRPHFRISPSAPQNSGPPLPDEYHITTTIIGQFARNHHHQYAISMFSRLLYFNVRPNEYTFATVLHSSTCLKALSIGKQFHAIATKMGLSSNVFVASSLLHLYVKLGMIEEARRAFQDTYDPNVVSYTTMICGYLKNERFEDARLLFSRMPERNVVSWNAMIGGYSQMGQTEEAVNLFIEMYRQGFQPNESTFPCVFSAVANIAAHGMGKSFHACAFKVLGSYGVFVGNSIISFYAKCGNMEDSLLAFNRLHGKNTVSWNAIICGYAHNGRGKEALQFFQKMRGFGIRPNGVTLLCVLLACNHAGLVDEGYSCFNRAKNEYPSVLRPEHYACMVDLLSRSGRFGEAKRFLRELPFNPGIGFWKALLGGCQIHSNMELADLAAREIRALDPEDVSSYVMLSNADSAAGRWLSVSMIRKEMREKGMARIPGCSWIEISGKVHVFLTGEKRHGQMDDIYMLMGYCFKHLKEIPTTSSFSEY